MNDPHTNLDVTNIDVTLQSIKTLLDPLQKGVRRAVISEHGMICDKVYAPDHEEVDALSNICQTVFKTESRDIPTLMHRCFIEDIPNAWTALFNDLRIGIPMTGYESYIDHMYPCIQHASTFERVYIAGSLLVTYHTQADIPLNTKVNLEECIDAVQKYTGHSMYSELVSVYQQLVRHVMFPVKDIGDMLMTRPELCILCLYHPHIDQVCITHPTIVNVLSDAAMVLPPRQRHPYIVMLALFSRHGSRIDHPVGLDTLVQLKHASFPLNLVAAAAVLAQPKADPTVASLCTLIETLCTVIQKKCHLDVIYM